MNIDLEIDQKFEATPVVSMILCTLANAYYDGDADSRFEALDWAWQLWCTTEFDPDVLTERGKDFLTLLPNAERELDATARTH